MRAKKNNITCYPVNNGYFNRGLKRCKIDGDVSDANTKVYGDCSAIFKIFKRLKWSSSYMGAAMNK